MLTGDTAHVVAEWQTPWGPLVTGAVYEWPERRRPGDYAKHQGELTRRWYVFTPVDGVLGLEELPIRLGSRRALLNDFTAELRRLGRDHPALGLSYAPAPADWAVALKARSIDPGIFRYQKDMNRTEGAIDERFRFSSEEAFIDFLIDMVVDEEAPESVAKRMRDVAGKLSRRKDKTAELAYCEGVAERLGPVQTAWAEQRRLQTGLAEVVRRATRLDGELRAAQAAATTAAQQAAAQAAAAAAQLSAATTSRLAARDTALEYRRLGANLWVAEEREALRLAGDARDAAELDADAWQAVELLLAMERHRAQIAGIDAQVAEQAARAEPARLRRNAAALRLRVRLARLATDTATAAEQASHREAQQLARAKAAAAAVTRSHKLATAAAAEHDFLDKQLAGQLAARDKAIADGHLLAGEPPADGLTRARQRDGDLAATAARLDAELAAKQTRQGEIVGELAAADQDRRAAEQARDVARAEAAELRQQATELASSERLCELAQTTMVAVWAAAATLQRRLQEEIADARRRMAGEVAQTLRDRRAHAALSGDEPHRLRVLPPSEDAEAVLEVLDREEIRAVPGLVFLANSVRRDAWEATIAAHPGLLSGVLVDPDDEQDARSALLAAGLRPASLVTVAPKTAVLDLRLDNDPADSDQATGEQAFVVPPVAALFDPEQADSERARIAGRLEGADQRSAAHQARQDADRDLLDRLRRLLDRCPAGHLDALDGRAAAHDARAVAAGAQLERLQGEQAGITAWLRAAPARRTALEEERLILSRSIAVLEPLAEAFAARGTLEQQREDAAARTRIATAQAEQEASVEATAREAATAAHDEAQRLSGQARDLTQRHANVTLIGADDDHGDDAERVADDPAVATEVLHDTFLRLDEAYWGAAGTAVLQERRARAQQDLRAATEQHTALPQAARRRAAVLRATPAAADPARRAAARDHARREHQRLLGEVAVRTAELARAEAEQIDAAPPRGNVFRTLPDSELPTDRADAQTRQRAAEAEAQRHQAVATQATQDRDRADDRRRTQEGRATVLGLLASGLTNAVNALGIAPPPAATDIHPYPGSIEDATAAQEALLGELHAAAAQLTRARSHLHGQLSALRGFAKEFTGAGWLRDAVLPDDPELVAVDTERLIRQHQQRAAVLREELASIAEDQEILVGDLTGQVRQLIDLLTRAGKVRLPDGLGAWRGKPFLTIAFDDPTGDEAELRRRVNDQVEAIIDRGAIPDGIATLKQALHAAVPKGFRTRLLKPTVDLVEDRVPVTVMGKWSGGEKLTAAVALYCTLARLRAGASPRHLGLGADSGALVLDNPLGKSSYVGFVALQRRIAAFLHVQLIYTTAVRDLKAVGRFPNVIRCRNIRPPGRNRSYLVVAERLGDAHDTPVTGVVGSARVVRLDPGDTAATDGDEPDLATQAHSGHAPA